MEEIGTSRVEVIGKTTRKKRSHIFRRPPPESDSVPTGSDISPLSSTPLSDDIVTGSSDENTGGDHSSRRKELSLSHCSSRCPPTNGHDDEKLTKNSKKTEVRLDELYGSTSEGGQRTMGLNDGKNGGAHNENKVKKVKLKVGGVTRTIDANSSLKGSHSSETTVQRLKFVHKGDTNTDTPSTDKKAVGLKGIPWKDFSRGGFTLGREEPSLTKSKGNSVKLPDPTRKTKRAPKKRPRDGFDDDNDDEIRYLEKLKTARVSTPFDDEEDSGKKKHVKLSIFTRNMDCMEVEDVSDGELDGTKKKKVKKDSVDESAVEPKRELGLTTRQRALQSGRDTSSPGGNGVEFPNGLPPATSRSKPKEQLTEVEQQLRKAEIAQRRKMQNEKAARESEAEAIRRILGQDSKRKAREEKKKKREEELAQEKEAEELLRVANSIRWVDGPNGITVTFPKDMGFPSIFNSNSRYPPPRETCAGPSCKNPYKYRDSKTRLPLCSLQCYKAVQTQAAAATC